MKPKIFVSTVPFANPDTRPLDNLIKTGWEIVLNPHGRKLKDYEVAELAKDCDGLVAGTENVGELLESCKKLKIISRVGIGLDSVPLEKCRQKGIKVCYTPDAVTMAVAELTVGMMVTLTRHVGISDKELRQGSWNRRYGKRLQESIIGIIGAGRIGKNVIRLLREFKPKEILVNDIKNKSSELQEWAGRYNLSIRSCEKAEIYKNSDIITLHIPLSSKSKNMITAKELNLFSKNSYLINTARGGIVNENDLYTALKNGTISGAAVDVYEKEPYRGVLTELNTILLTHHMGSCSYDCRSEMELQAALDVIRFFKGEPLQNEVPEEEYEYQK